MTSIRTVVWILVLAAGAATGAVSAEPANSIAQADGGSAAAAIDEKDAQAGGAQTGAADGDGETLVVADARGKNGAKSKSKVKSKEAPKKPVVAAKQLFGAAKNAAPLAARAIGYYSRGCLSGARQLPIDGPAWQAMRLSRHRNWGHPDLIRLVERLATEAQKKDGWPGLLVGDIAQPRGGPMLTGHASHQIGLDADIWLTPMPNRRLSEKEREDLSATSMLAADDISVSSTVWTPEHVALIKRAASYHEVERVLVHPAIKKALCEAAGADRAWLGKVRPYWGHYYHFHMRISCPAGSTNCKHQQPVSGEDGCGKELADWIKRVTPRPPAPPPPPGTKPAPKKPPPPPMTLEGLPPECREVITAGNPGVPKPLLAKALEAANSAKTAKAGTSADEKSADAGRKPADQKPTAGKVAKSAQQQ